MTCFGAVQLKSDMGTVEVSIKSVNGRFLEIRTNLPPEFLKFESDIKRKVAQKLQRGTITVFVNRKKDPSKIEFKVSLKKDLVKKWSTAFEELSETMGVPTKPTLDSLAQMKELFVIEEDSSVHPTEEKILFATLKKALSACEKEKLREGRSILSELLKFLGQLSKHIITIEKNSLSQQTLLKKQYDKHLLNLTHSESLDQRLAQDIVSQIDRVDISEEISRFKEHLKSIKILLRSKEQIGKKLDFYTQELLREMNTVGSKSQMFKITQSVVESKSVIERLREQSQNIE